MDCTSRLTQEEMTSTYDGRSSLDALRHLLSFFTPLHNEHLSTQAKAAEHEACVPETIILCNLFDHLYTSCRQEKQRNKAAAGGMFASMASATAAAAAAAQHDGTAPDRGTSAHTARAEIALAWLMAVIVPQLEETEHMDTLGGGQGSVQNQSGNSGAGLKSTPNDSDHSAETSL